MTFLLLYTSFQYITSLTSKSYWTLSPIFTWHQKRYTFFATEELKTAKRELRIESGGLRPEICARTVNREQRVVHQRTEDRSLKNWIILFFLLEVAVTPELKISTYLLFIYLV